MAWTHRYEQECLCCHKGTNEACDNCEKPFCGHGACLFGTGKKLTFDSDPRNEDYAERPTWNRAEELCMSCYIERIGHPPFALWAETSAHSTLNFNLIEKGAISPAGDYHSWYMPPSAGKMLRLKWGDKEIELDTYRTLELLEWLKANEGAIVEHAKKTSSILIPESHRRTEAAMRADAGAIDYSEFE